MPVKDSGWKGAGKALFIIKTDALAVGIDEKAAAVPYETPSGKPGATLGQVALIQEFGAPEANIPERSYLRATIDAEAATLDAALTRLVGRSLDAGDRANDVLKGGLLAIGTYTVGRVQARISDGIAPANKPSTIARKGSSTPLIDTGRLRQSITVVIRREFSAEAARTFSKRRMRARAA